MPIKNGDKIKVEYTGTLDDGTVFDTSEGREPLEFEVGARQVIKGFDEAVLGLEIGEEKKVNLAPSESYGEYDPNLIKKISLDKLPPGEEPKPGMVLELRTSDGISFPARITEVAEQDITIDLNHPLAGKNLIFQIKVVDIS
ncbi:MAG: peptidylprolyl isomerase [Promethearchaeota archaeon]